MTKRRIALIAAMLGSLSLMPAASAAGEPGLSDARNGTARFHQIRHAERAGYESTLDVLGCFENPGVGGMGLHYVDFDLVDDIVDASAPEALVYEMRPNGQLKLVGLEYLVPIESVDPDDPPALFGQAFHPHPVLPFWILHAWIWQPNPSGMFSDWNPAVGMCPDGVPIFGS